MRSVVLVWTKLGPSNYVYLLMKRGVSSVAEFKAFGAFAISPSTQIGCLLWSLGNPMPVYRASCLVLRGDMVTTTSEGELTPYDTDAKDDALH